MRSAVKSFLSLLACVPLVLFASSVSAQDAQEEIADPNGTSVDETLDRENIVTPAEERQPAKVVQVPTNEYWLTGDTQPGRYTYQVDMGRERPRPSGVFQRDSVPVVQPYEAEPKNLDAH